MNFLDIKIKELKEASSLDMSEDLISSKNGYGYTQERVNKRLNRERITLRKGNIYLNSKNNRQCELIEYVDDNSHVMVRYVDNLTTEMLSIFQLEVSENLNNEHNNVDLSAISDTNWDKANVKYEAIKPLLGTNYYNTSLVRKRATETGVSERSLYRWLKAYNDVGSIIGLVNQKRGWSDGKSRLKPEQDKIIHQVINDFYLTKQRHSLEQTFREVFRQCYKENIEKPSKKAIRDRIMSISERERLNGRGQTELAKQKFRATPNQFPGADYPLSVVQIDHTPVDLMIVDDIHRKPIGRPFLTIAIDIYSRMVTGYYISLDAPSTTSVAMCIARSILPKESLLIEKGIHDVEWSVFGYPQKIHVDNGADFRSNTLGRSCAAHGINLEFRPIGEPNFGGHVERLIRTMMEETHSVSGTTFSNIHQKDNYNSEKESSMTLAEFETWLLTFITKVYHKRIHSSLLMSPSAKWKIGIYGNDEVEGIGIPSIPKDERTLLLDFMPAFERTIQHFGVTIDNIRYYDAPLSMFINSTELDRSKTKFIFRRDPRDISKIWFYDPLAQQYLPIVSASQQIPQMSIWEYKQARKKISEYGEKFVNEHQLYDAITEMREIATKSSKTTKKARKQTQRRKNHNKSQNEIIDPVVEMEAHSIITSGHTSNSSRAIATSLSDDDDFEFGEID